MLDQTALFTAIITKIDNTSGLSAIHGKVYSDVVPSQGEGGPAVPYCKMETYGDPVVMRLMGIPDTMTKLTVQFTVYSTTRHEAGDLIKSISDAFDRQPLTITGQKLLLCQLVSQGSKFESTLPTTIMYSAFVRLEYLVQSS